jgi:hypothetical protein
LNLFSVRVRFREKRTRPFAITVTDSRRLRRIPGADAIRHSVAASDSQQLRKGKGSSQQTEFGMRRLLLTLLVTASSLSAAALADVPREFDDILLTIKARQILYQDKELQSYNVGVQVVDRVATLFGPIPKSELSRRAETRLRELFELRGVRNDLRVLPSPPTYSNVRSPTPAPFSKQESNRPATGQSPTAGFAPRSE